MKTSHNQPEEASGAPPTGHPHLVSVIVPAYKAEAHLGAALDSALAQTYPFFEILVVEDGSADGTKRVADEFARRYPGRVTVLQHVGGVNRGVAASRNLAISRAKGTYTAFLDADDTWYPTKLARQIRYMELCPQVGLSFAKARIVRQGQGRFFMQDTEILGHQPPRDLRDTVKRILTLELNYVFSTIMVRTDIARNVGGFRDHLPFQSEDRIFVAMVASSNMIGRIPMVLGEYHVTDSSYTTSVVMRNRLATTIVFDMQVRLIDWLIQNGNRPLAVYLVARFLPGSLMRCAYRLRPSTFSLVCRDLAALCRCLPHWMLISLFHRLTLPLAFLRKMFRQERRRGR